MARSGVPSLGGCPPGAGWRWPDSSEAGVCRRESIRRRRRTGSRGPDRSPSGRPGPGRPDRACRRTIQRASPSRRRSGTCRDHRPPSPSRRRRAGEGGISTPLIAHWPRGIAAERRGKLEHQPGHLIDIMATCVDLGGHELPQVFRGSRSLPLEGTSLRPAAAGRPLERSNPIFWEHEGIAPSATESGSWCGKATLNTGKMSAWELYDMQADRTELHDLAAEMPERVQAMSETWEAWAKRALWSSPGPGNEAETRRKKQQKCSNWPPASCRGTTLPRPGASRSRSRRASRRAGEGVLVAQGGVTHATRCLSKAANRSSPCAPRAR